MEFKSQVCTTKEQSQRLLDLGLKPETADMVLIKELAYDAVEATKKELNDFCFIACHSCDLDKKCNKHDAYELCRNVLGTYTYFKKSDKKFER